MRNFWPQQDPRLSRVYAAKRMNAWGRLQHRVRRREHSSDAVRQVKPLVSFRTSLALQPALPIGMVTCQQPSDRFATCTRQD